MVGRSAAEFNIFAGNASLGSRTGRRVEGRTCIRSKAARACKLVALRQNGDSVQAEER
jgi:hypothetical protein